MDVEHGRFHAKREGDFVVFLVGMRINRLRAIHRWLPVFLSAPRMVREQEADPSGLLDSRAMIAGPREFQLIQYWESFEALRDYARAGEEHRSMWSRFNERFGDGAVGIWHETYLVREGEYETVYRDMPATGIGDADGSTLVPADGQRETAGGRLGVTDGSDVSVAADGGERR
ncbi:MAG: DUF4188 domain-containing protein [Haloglomus sp.]